MTVMCNEVFAHQIWLFSQHFAQTDSLSKADGDCLDWFFHKKGSDFDLIGMCSGSFWFMLVCDNSSKILLGHFEKFFIKILSKNSS